MTTTTTTLERYLDAISFAEVGPGQATKIRSPVALRSPREFARMVRESNRFEVHNTQLPDGDEMAARLRPVLLVPRMSSYVIGAIVNRAVAELPDGVAYVNVGVWHGFTYFAGVVGNESRTCIAVDNFSEFGQEGAVRQRFLRRYERLCGPAQQFHEMDCGEYFADVHEGPIGVYYYDGNHQYDDQVAGLRSAEPYFAPGCVILVDDTNWEGPRNATLRFVEESPDDYEVLLDQRTVHGAHPTYWNGLLVLRKR